jgi:hypothetical protein
MATGKFPMINHTVPKAVRRAGLSFTYVLIAWVAGRISSVGWGQMIGASRRFGGGPNDLLRLV